MLIHWIFLKLPVLLSIWISDTTCYYYWLASIFLRFCCIMKFRPSCILYLVSMWQCRTRSFIWFIAVSSSHSCTYQRIFRILSYDTDLSFPKPINLSRDPHLPDSGNGDFTISRERKLVYQHFSPLSHFM